MKIVGYQESMRGTACVSLYTIARRNVEIAFSLCDGIVVTSIPISDCIGTICDCARRVCTVMGISE